jgi:hypothetical protein
MYKDIIEEKGIPSIQGIQATAKRCKADGYMISEYSLRRAIASGAIPCRKIGRAVKVFYPNVIEWLTCSNGQDNQPVEDAVNGIRRVN